MKNRWLIGALILATVLIALYVPRLLFRKHGNYGARTRMRFADIERALKGYYDVYRMHPSNHVPALIRILCGANENGQNPNAIRFLELQRNSVDADGNILDEWGQPIMLTLGGSTNVLLRSLGKNQKDDGGSDDDVVVQFKIPQTAN